MATLYLSVPPKTNHALIMQISSKYATTNCICITKTPLRAGFLKKYQKSKTELKPGNIGHHCVSETLIWFKSLRFFSKLAPVTLNFIAITCSSCNTYSIPSNLGTCMGLKRVHFLPKKTWYLECNTKVNIDQ